MDGFVHDPTFLPGYLENKDVVDVVMRVESPVARRRDVGVGLDGVAEVVDRLADEVDQRRPQPVQALQHNRRAGSEFAEHLARIHLVRHLGTEPGRSEIAVPGQHVTLLGQPDERRAYPAFGDQLVDGVWPRADRRSRGAARRIG